MLGVFYARVPPREASSIIGKEAGDFFANKLFSVPDSVSPIGSVVQKHRRAPFYKKTPVEAASVGMFFSQVASWYPQWCTW